MRKTLYVTDLDGTLLRNDKSVSKAAAETLNRLIDRGMLITYATTRSCHSAFKLLGNVDFGLPAIIRNGTVFGDPQTGKETEVILFDPEEVQAGRCMEGLELCGLEAVRARAVQKLKERYGCQRLVVFGDSLNDLPMFQIADEAYAVENAMEEVKAVATGIIPGNEEDGVARWLQAEYDRFAISAKKEIRRKALALRDGLGAPERERGRLLLTERILGHQWFYQSQIILGFASFGSEIDIWELLQEALRLGKRLFLPKVTGEDQAQMRFFPVRRLEELREGYRGIPEPSDDREEYVYSEAGARHTLMLMPGAAFDSYRNRVGYGKGFYDRFLADKEALQLRTIAVGYACQLVDEIPADERDIKPYQVICV